MVDAMLTGRIGAERLAWVLAEGTARLYGLYPRKGALEVGADADFTLVDPSATTVVDQQRLHSKQPQSPWHGRQLRGRTCMTILRGEVVARDGEPIGAPRGRLIRAQHRPADQPSKPNPLAFTAELDTVVTPDIVPATVFGAAASET
jgi:N-acyl-D-aspartate/D-glutamate deacylase